jgi:hypothetical protein
MTDTAHPEDLDVARPLLSTRVVLRSFWVMCVLVLGSVPAWAQPAPARPISVEQARPAVTAAEKTYTALVTQRAQLTARYQQQLIVVDGLKKQKRSWRRDRELNTAQASANDTATRLTALDKQLATAQQALAKARRAVVSAIDAELAAGANDPRADELKRLRVQLAPAAPVPKKIVIPDAEIDPLADPDELERQAAAIAAAEKLLEAQRLGLDKQHTELVRVAELRQAHDRAIEQSTQEDDQPHRGAPRGGNSRTAVEGAPSPSGDDGAGGAGNGSGASPPGETSTGGSDFGSDKSAATSFDGAAVALGEVIDRSTIDGMLRAQRSGDPKQRAAAAAQARDAVAKRLELLKKKRAMIEARAKKLRKP